MELGVVQSRACEMRPQVPARAASSGTRAYRSPPTGKRDGRLAVVQRYEHRGSREYGAWEEYRYDALGRRVLTRVRRPNTGQPLAGTTALCTATAGDVCSSYTERVWWAGDAILQETRTADGSANPTNSGDVAYVHAPGVRGIDAPVAVRMGGVVRVLSAEWRGLGETSLFPTGAPADNTISGGPAITLAWPSGRGAYFTPYLNAAPGSWASHTWAGSLVEHGAGAAGLLYRRNRYYDPASGRFTQQDPIGLGGGLNVYGFAGGDPVNYTDPFGLCPGIPNTNQLDPTDCPPGYFQVLFASIGGGGGADPRKVHGGTGGAALCTATGVGAVVAPGCAAAGGFAGAAARGAASGALDRRRFWYVARRRSSDGQRGQGAGRQPRFQR